MATHKQLMKKFAGQANIPLATVERVYAFLRQEIKGALADDGVAKLDDLVTFQVADQAARTARNPHDWRAGGNPCAQDRQGQGQRPGQGIGRGCVMARVKPEEPAATTPDAGGWIEWNGGSKYPVDGDAVVQVIMRDGCHGKIEACLLRWTHDGSSGDIVRYRVVRQADQPATPAAEPQAERYVFFAEGDSSTSRETGDQPGSVLEPDATVSATSKLNAAINRQATACASDDPLSHQVGGSHYRDCAIQPVEFIEANQLGFLEGCVVKRLARHNKPTGKGRQDIEKAIHELQILLAKRYQAIAEN